MRPSILLVMIAVAGASAAKAQAPETLPAAAKAPAGNVEKGKEIYVSYGCYQCHNYGAHGGSAGPKLVPNLMAYPAFMKQMREPRDQMPPYTETVMVNQDVADIYAYLQTIPPPPAVDSIPILKP